MIDLAHYELLELLGEGGMGLVYRAVHHPSGLEVAIKTLHPSFRNDRFRRRLLLDEATAAAKVEHPRIVRLLDVDRDDDGVPFLVMELSRGKALDGLVTPWAGAQRIGVALLGVLEGLAAAHAAGIVHRDLKPANVLVDLRTGDARILDFGVASLLDPLREHGSGGIVGTPEYMAPEQLSGNGPVGPWTDLYAFGVMLAEIIRGRSPFADIEGLTGLLVAKGLYVPSRAPDVREGLDVPPSLQDLIERLLRPHPRARPRFAVEVAAELSRSWRAVRESSRVWVDVATQEHELSTHPTTVEPWLGACAPVVDEDRITELELRTRLRAVPDVALGAGIARLRELPLVGREEARAELVLMIEEVSREKVTRLLAYVGEAGIGKSRLARWGLSYVEQTGTMEGAAGGYDPSGADLAGGLRHALRRVVGMPAKGIAEAWRWLEGEPGLDLDRLARFLRAGEDEHTMPAEIVVRLAHAALRAASRARPIYLWLDDLGWARDGALDLVEALLDANDVPLLIVATMRTGTIQHGRVRERIARLMSHARARTRDVAELDAEDRARLLDQIAPLEPGVSRALAERIEGSPMLLVQLVHDWRARGLLEPHGGSYRPRDGVSVDELLVERPLAALLADRVGELLAAFGAHAALAEEVLGRAALLGVRFEQAALRSACARDEPMAAAVDEVLDRALLVGLLRAERGGVYAFDHGLVHEALVQRAHDGPRRVAALVDAANGLVARYGKHRADVAALVADLLHRAGDHDRAWDCQLRAIERAAWSGDDFAAQSYHAVARTWTVTAQSRVARLDHAEARLHYYALRYDRALEAITRARSLAAAAGDALLVTVCDACEADVLFYQDRFTAAERIAHRCFGATSRDDPELADVRAQVSQRLAEIAVLRGDLEGALLFRRETQASAESTGRSWRVRIAQLNVAEILAVLGRSDDAREICERVEADAKSERDQEAAIAARETLARVEVLAGRGPPMRAFLEARLAQIATLGDAWRLSGMLPFTALLAAELDEDAALDPAVEQLIGALEVVPHDEAFTIAAMRRLASRLSDRGRFDLARRVDVHLEARAQRYRAGLV